MTVILVLLFICIFLGIDWLKNREHRIRVPADAFVHSWGLTMADGGTQIAPKTEKVKLPIIDQDPVDRIVKIVGYEEVEVTK